MLIERQPHRSSENNPECNWRSRESASATRDYCGQKQMSFYQPLQYNDRQQYQQNRTSQKTSSYNTYGSEKQYHHSNNRSGIPITPREYVPIIPNKTAQ